MSMFVNVSSPFSSVFILLAFGPVLNTNLRNLLFRTGFKPEEYFSDGDDISSFRSSKYKC
jgi:hypothetical protein